ncbi:translation initiation factor IF-2-like [Vulpes lagopus]|uniref:translation initiation factor IF-2-like n=1 Tax=Vulpes lagopus TaxID=494514 RepID=UPI001BCA4912|nr:translation initiation factor IF-2-like [Vulpes lagopus]
MGGGREAPELGENWSSGRRTKVSERAAQLGGGAGPASDAPGLLPVLVTAPGAGPPAPAPRPPPPPRPAMQAPLHTDGSHENTSPASGRAGNNTRGRGSGPRPPPLPPPPGPPGGGGRRDPGPEGAAAASGGGRTAARGPLRAGAVRGEDQSPRRRARRMLPPRSPARAPPGAPRAGGHPRIPGGGGRAPSSPRSSARAGLEKAPVSTLQRRGPPWSCCSSIPGAAATALGWPRRG